MDSQVSSILGVIVLHLQEKMDFPDFDSIVVGADLSNIAAAKLYLEI